MLQLNSHSGHLVCCWLDSCLSPAEQIGRVAYVTPIYMYIRMYCPHDHVNSEPNGSTIVQWIRLQKGKGEPSNSLLSSLVQQSIWRSFHTLWIYLMHTFHSTFSEWLLSCMISLICSPPVVCGLSAWRLRLNKQIALAKIRTLVWYRYGLNCHTFCVNG